MSEWIKTIGNVNAAKKTVVSIQRKLNSMETGIDQEVINVVHEAVTEVGTNESKILVHLLKSCKHSCTRAAIRVLTGRGIDRIYYKDLHTLIAGVKNKSDYVHVSNQLTCLKNNAIKIIGAQSPTSRTGTKIRRPRSCM